MKNKLLAFTLSVVVLSPLALTFALVAISPFESVAVSQNVLTVDEKELPIPHHASQSIKDY